MAETYLAEFDAPAGKIWVAALKWSVQRGPLLATEWWSLLRSSTDVDITLRIGNESDPSVLLLLTASRAESLTGLIEALDLIASGPSVTRATSAAEFDALADLQDYIFHLWAHHDGYHRNNYPLACDFRMYSSWVGQASDDDVMYQVCLRPHPSTPEVERSVRKYLAWLDLEQPFSEPVRELQKILSQRLLGPTWLADEYLLFKDQQRLVAWQERIESHFTETTGRIGFAEAPLEVGDFSDLLTLGYHTARDRACASAVPIEAAGAYSNDEIVWLARQSLIADAPGSPDTVPEIFVSYASADFAQADAVRQYLESNGHRCWIAPRDINTGGLSYTEAIPQAIRKVNVVIVLVSGSANLSEHIPRELDLAVEQKLPIIPIRLADLLPSGQLEYLLRTCQWLDLFNRDHDTAMDELSTRINSLGI